MRNPHQRLLELAEQVFSEAEFDHMLDIAQLDDQNLYQWGRLFEFDEKLGGPGVHNIHRPGNRWPGAEGRYHQADRDVFRPIQYCAVYLRMQDPNAIPWLSREIVHMAGLQLESLTKKLVGGWRLPLGRLLHVGDSRMERIVGPSTWSQLKSFTALYNDAKHALYQDKDSHLFQPTDAVLAYFVSRRLALALYPHVKLRTPWETWQQGRTVEPKTRPWSVNDE